MKQMRVKILLKYDFNNSSRSFIWHFCEQRKFLKKRDGPSKNGPIIAVSRRKIIAVSRRKIIAVSRRKIIAVWAPGAHRAHGPRPLGPIGPIRSHAAACSHAVAWVRDQPGPSNCMAASSCIAAYGPYGPRGLGPWALWVPGAHTAIIFRLENHVISCTWNITFHWCHRKECYKHSFILTFRYASFGCDAIRQISYRWLDCHFINFKPRI